MTFTHIIACIALAVAIAAAFTAYSNHRRIVGLYGMVALIGKDKLIKFIDKMKADLEEMTDDKK